MNGAATIPNSALIDGRAYPLVADESILEFVRRHCGADRIPVLCFDARLRPSGSCRLCSVEVASGVDDPRRVVAACHTPVTEGMRLYCNSPRIQRLRRNIIELVLSDHPDTIETCKRAGDNAFRRVVSQVGIDKVRYLPGRNHLNQDQDRSHPYMVSNLSDCIRCYRCVRACDEIQGEFVLSVHGRGFDSRIIKGLDQTFDQSSCVACGACVQVCPTNAITDVDRMAASAPERTVRTVCSYCGVGCSLEVAVAENRILSISAPETAEVNQGHTCLKGRYAFRFYEHTDRLRSPRVRRNGVLAKATWDEAYDLIVERLRRYVAQDGPDSVAGISSARCTNEENYLMQKFMRAVIGTNNIDGCARVCHAPTAHGMQAAFGTGAATNSLDDIAHADVLMVIGANPRFAHPVTGARLKQAAMRGRTLIVIDPLETELAHLAAYHLQLRPGTNVALLNMLAHYIVTENLVDREFVAQRCSGFHEVEARLRGVDMEAMQAITGVTCERARLAAVAYASAERAMAFHGLGVTEHSQGSRAVMLIANLAMMTGNIGRPGVGVNPLRGQNNVQGAADMGVQPHLGAGYLDVTDPQVQRRYAEHYGRPVPAKVGYTIPEMLTAAETGSLKALWIIGEDIVQTDPNSRHVAQCLENLEFLVVQDLFLSETAKLADVVLPASSVFEKSGTFTNGERRVQRVNQVIDPLPGTKPDGQIITEVMRRMGYPQPDYSADGVLAEVSGIVPFFKGARWADLGDDGKQWPILEDGTGTPILHQVSFKRGKGRFHFFDFEESPEIAENLELFPFVLTTGRNLIHYNSGTMTRRTGNRDILGEDRLMIHPLDAKGKGIADCDLVRVRSARGTVELRAQFSTGVKPGTLYTTFHFPESMVNRLTSSVTDRESRCPEYKVTAVDVELAPA